MEKLLLDSLEIHRFRAFRYLSIEKLGRVNLIVGKNNVGKSCLLDALKFYSGRATPNLIWQILGSHDEGTINSRMDDEEALSLLKYLFYSRQEIKLPVDPIQIGPINSKKDRLVVTIDYFTREKDEEGRISLQPILLDKYDSAENVIPRFSIQFGINPNVYYPLNNPISSRLFKNEIGEIPCIALDSNGLNQRRIGELWDKIALTNQEKDVLASLRIIAPGVENISIIGDISNPRERYCIIKVAGADLPIPLRSLGDGMQRMLGLSLALVNAKNGILLIDEIENGLHYSIQEDLWKLVFQIAKRFNIQVFATSHSWDCISAFQKVAQKDLAADSLLIRIENKKGEIRTTLFDERKLEIATREQIEVR